MKFAKKQQLYRIDVPEGTFSKGDMTTVLDGLSGFGFTPIDDDPEEASSQGFVSALDEMKDVKDDGIMFGDAYIFGLRTDTRKVDKKAVKVLLEREVRKSGRLWKRQEKKEREEQIMLELRRRAIPLPSTQLIFIMPQDDAIYVVANKQKKAEEIFEFLSQALNIPYNNVVFAEEEDEETRAAFLEYLWTEHAEGRGNLFFPKSVSGGESTTQSTDEADLAFGRINGKKCACGEITLPTNVIVELKTPTFHAMKITAQIPDDAEAADKGEELGMLAGFYNDAFNDVRRMYDAFRNDPKDGDAMKNVFERTARNVLGA